MAHLRGPTSNTISPHITSLNHLTLASHNRSTSLSPLDSPWGDVASLARSRLEANDFQSNAQVETNPCPPSFGTSLSGLGIRFVDPLNIFSKQDVERTRTPHAQSQADGTDGGQVQTCQQHQDGFAQYSEPYFPHLWSPPPSLSTSRLGANDLARSHSLPGDNVLSHGPNSSVATWSFDSLAAASGIPTHTLAEQLSSTADLALQYMTDGHQSSFSSLVDLDLSNDDRRVDWPVLPPFKNDGTYLLETTERKSISSVSEAAVGINPVDLMGDVFYDSDQSRISFPLSASLSSSSRNSMDGPAPPAHTGMRKTRKAHDILCDIRVNQDNPAPSFASGEHHISQQAESDSDKENSDYEQSAQDPSSRESSPFPSPRPRKRPHAKKARRPTQKIPLLKSVLSPPKPRPIKTHVDSADINLGTPVFDAHKGIYLEDLEAKAERYRLRNPGQTFDNNWLVSFAGKLSSQGELVNEYRCYVVGCTQTNKRRDHILIHIGGHLDQRPFECSYW